ncbi:M56 family metallopeptidase [Natranaerofaba carboxydovora]|uniref:M56 family metallopeptidase n=1 Tax=Natranaerofaba carboxydovora TaxID=2742683 RepID=UPI001F12E362|nr:M56 family metallopeptidase [Natranaerofaba carboxydovora]UMZ74578.1 Methicillin resistance mecR1 protein [Natranaerofaba carboxydovora]
MEEIILIYQNHSLMPYVILSSAILFLMVALWSKAFKPSSLVLRRLYLLVIILPIISYPVFYFSFFRTCGYVNPDNSVGFPFIFPFHFVCKLGGFISTWIVPLSLIIFIMTLFLSFKAYKKRINFIKKARKVSLSLNNDDKIHSILDDLAFEMNLKNRPDVYIIFTEETISFTSGVFKPEIYISESLLGLLDEKELKGVIAHELSHIKLKDTTWDVVMTVVSYMLFFSPFSLLAKKMYMKEREEACDVLASLYTKEPLSLGRGLLKVKKSQSQNPNPVVAGFSWTKGGTARRVENLLWFDDNGFESLKLDKIKEVAFVMSALMFLFYLC